MSAQPPAVAFPTPYDIAPIPYFPYEPTLADWATFLALAGSALFAAWSLSRFITRRVTLRAPAPGMTLAAVEELRDLCRQGHLAPQEALLRASLVLRRFAGLLLRRPVLNEVPDLAACTAHELEVWLQQEDLAIPADFISAMLAVERSKFSERGSDVSHALAVLESSCAALRKYAEHPR